VAPRDVLRDAKKKRFALTVNQHLANALNVAGGFPFEHQPVLRATKHVDLPFLKALLNRRSIEITQCEDLV